MSILNPNNFQFFLVFKEKYLVLSDAVALSLSSSEKTLPLYHFFIIPNIICT